MILVTGATGTVGSEVVPCREDFADIAIEGAALVRSGGNAIVTGDVPAVLGRPARSFRVWADEHRVAFR